MSENKELRDALKLERIRYYRGEIPFEQMDNRNQIQVRLEESGLFGKPDTTMTVSDSISLSGNKKENNKSK